MTIFNFNENAAADLIEAHADEYEEQQRIIQQMNEEDEALGPDYENWMSTLPVHEPEEPETTEDPALPF